MVGKVGTAGVDDVGVSCIGFRCSCMAVGTAKRRTARASRASAGCGCGSALKLVARTYHRPDATSDGTHHKQRERRTTTIVSLDHLVHGRTQRHEDAYALTHAAVAWPRASGTSAAETVAPIPGISPRTGAK